VDGAHTSFAEQATELEPTIQQAGDGFVHQLPVWVMGRSDANFDRPAGSDLSRTGAQISFASPSLRMG
jgi:hypothetical protein